MMLEYKEKIEFDSDLDLTTTLESGQTFLWNTKDAQMFDESRGKIYQTCRRYKKEVVGIEIKQVESDEILVKSSSDTGTEIVSTVLGKNQYDIEEIQSEIKSRDKDAGVMEEAINQYSGLRLVKEPLFETLISFICSTQMRVGRIHTMINNIREMFGDSITPADGKTMYSFPTPKQLSRCTERELRDLKLGYRSEYVKETVDDFINTNNHLPDEAEEARQELKNYKGVGTKVADCVLLYSGAFWGVVPVDTWIDSAVKEYYPEISGGSKESVARKFESMFGEYAGFAQAYLFHYMRQKSSV